ncbi:hypothetical protein [Nonomuraea sp. KM90]|uniref:hypothetical protein n=1 Tax=Nonomuraea sp. KM90 TaxID=3457428 RepID=UPI003FCE3221
MPFEPPAEAAARRKREEELRAALREHGHQTGDRWWFSSSNATHTEEEALRIVEACLLLGAPVTDRVTSEVWWTLVSRVVALDKRVSELELVVRNREDYEMEMRDRGE